MKRSILGLILLVASAVNAEENMVQTSEMASPKAATSKSDARLIPHIGFNGFSLPQERGSVQLGRNYGMWVDLGSRYVTFETGLMITQAQAEGQTGNADPVKARTSNLGVPLFAKVNFSGNAESTIYAKLGGVLVPELGAGNPSSFPMSDVWATAGLGTVYPVYERTGLLLEANYIQPVGPEATSLRRVGMQGFALMAGASIAL
jgi:hypothetical protein